LPPLPPARRKTPERGEKAKPATKHAKILAPGVEAAVVRPVAAAVVCPVAATVEATVEATVAVTVTEPVPQPSQQRNVVVPSTLPEAEVATGNEIKDKYKYGDAFEDAEYISSTPIKRVAQARRYHHVRKNFIGSRRNFEYDPQDERTQREIKKAMESDETRQQWRMRMFSGGTMPVDAIMMVCHPQLYRALIEATPEYFGKVVSEQDQLQAWRAWLTMKGQVGLTHRVDDAMLPRPELWEKVRSNNPAGVGLTLPNGRVMPEQLATQVCQYTGMIMVNEAMVDKLGQVEGHVAELIELATGRKIPRPSIRDWSVQF
jgi:hypothetical protein